MSANIEAITRIRDATGASTAEAFRAYNALAALADGAKPPTAEGAVADAPGYGTVFAYVHHDRQGGALVEITTASDFAARTPTILELGPLVAAMAYGYGVERPVDLLGVITPGGATVAERLARACKALGEPVGIARVTIMRARRHGVS